MASLSIPPRDVCLDILRTALPPDVRDRVQVGITTDPFYMGMIVVFKLRNGTTLSFAVPSKGLLGRVDLRIPDEIMARLCLEA